jgi:hypothetical protein
VECKFGPGLAIDVFQLPLKMLNLNSLSAVINGDHFESLTADRILVPSADGRLNFGHVRSPTSCAVDSIPNIAGSDNAFRARPNPPLAQQAPSHAISLSPRSGANPVLGS